MAGKKVYSDLNMNSLKLAVVSGTTASTGITVTGIATADTIMLALAQNLSTLAISAPAGTISISAANTVITSGDDKANDLIIMWYDDSVDQR